MKKIKYILTSSVLAIIVLFFGFSNVMATDSNIGENQGINTTYIYEIDCGRDSISYEEFIALYPDGDYGGPGGYVDQYMSRCPYGIED